MYIRIESFHLFFFVSLGLGLNIIQAGEPGVRGATFLKISAGPRASGMGEAQVAVANDSYASYWNPAGLGQVNRTELAMTYQRSFQDIQEQNVNIAYPLTRRSTLGVYVTHLSVKPFTSFDASGNSTGEVESSDAAYGAAFGARITKHLYLGGAFKHLRSTLGPSEASSHAFDSGALIKIPFPKKDVAKHHLNLGFAIRNMGPALVYDHEKTKLPRTHQLGLGFETHVADHRLTCGVDYNFSPDHKSYITFGQEFWIKRILAVRAGYRFGQEEEEGIRAGVSIGLKGIQISYSISPFGFLGEAHRFGASYQFGPPMRLMNIPKPKPSHPAQRGRPVKPKSAPTTLEDPKSSITVPAQVKEKKKVVPKIEKKVVPAKKRKPAPKISPKKPPALKPIEKPKLPIDVPSLMDLGNKHLKEGRFDEATAAFGQALKIEPNNTKALELMRKSLNELDRKKRREQGIYE